MLLKLTLYVAPAKNRENSNWVLSSCLETGCSTLQLATYNPHLSSPSCFLHSTVSLPPSLLLSLLPSLPSLLPSFPFLPACLSACLPTFIYSWEHLIWVCFQCKMLILLTSKGSHTTARQVMFKSFTFQVYSMSYKLVSSTLNILLCVTVKWPFIDLHVSISGVWL